MKYFETKVMKVKKEKDYKLENLIKKAQEISKEIQLIRAAKAYKQGKWFGNNYVNNENIDKIKFPCFCSFSHPRLKDLRYGIITNTGYHCGYALIDVGSQSLGVHLMNTQHYLDKLIKEWDIHILRGKIIIFNDDMEDKYSDD